MFKDDLQRTPADAPGFVDVVLCRQRRIEVLAVKEAAPRLELPHRQRLAAPVRHWLGEDQQTPPSAIRRNSYLVIAIAASLLLGVC